MGTEITERLRFLSRQVRFWWQMLSGRSYYHGAQTLGKAFEAGRLEGYFNDLTGKTAWAGETDQNGVPVNTLSNGRKLQFPILITQKALGHWDRWLMEKNETDRSQFLSLCDWLMEHQDENGGWDTWQVLRGQHRLKYSAMAQGEAMSVLSRAAKLTGDTRYQIGAEKAFGLLLSSVKDGGVTHFEGEDVFLEEIPSEPRNTILNGWIFSLFGLYDYTLLFDHRGMSDMFEKSLNTLVRHLPSYDCGYWSYYDSARLMSSPFYHSLHISQLEALVLASGHPLFEEYRQRWTALQNKFSSRKRAFLVKAIQKLREPPSITITK